MKEIYQRSIEGISLEIINRRNKLRHLRYWYRHPEYVPGTIKSFYAVGIKTMAEIKKLVAIRREMKIISEAIKQSSE